MLLLATLGLSACGESGGPPLRLGMGAAPHGGSGAGGAGATAGQGGAAAGFGGVAGTPASAGTLGGAGAPHEPEPVSEAPSGLLCELLRRPELTAITDARPELSFISAAKRQSAYQILVASSRAALDADQGDAWDSGKQQSDRSIDIEYEGALLEPGQAYFWKVRTWNEADVVSPWSDVQSFTMAGSLGRYSTPLEPIEQTRRAPAQVKQVAAGHFFVDFGKHAFGWLELSLDAPASASVTVRLGERATGERVELAPGGSVRAASVQLALQPGQRTYRVETPKDTRNTSGDAVRLPAQLGVVMPFRYAEVVGSPVALDAQALRQVAVHYPYEEDASAFSSSNEDLNRVWDISKYSMVAPTFAGVYIDGDRERIPYEGDAYIQQLGHYSVDRDFALARYSHEYLLEHPTWPTEWKQHSVMMAWADWMYTGNTEALAQAYDTLVAEKTLEQHVGSDGLLRSAQLEDLVDWPEGERDGHVFTDVNTVVNAFFCRNLQQMAEIARALGKQSEAERYDAMAAKALAAFNQKLFDAGRGRYVDGVGTTHSSLHSNMLPLAFGLVPAAARQSVVDFVKSRGMACSVYGAQYLLEALYEAEEADAALALMTSDSDRGWLNMIRAGATITLEAWDAKYKPNLDWNHAWGGAPANILPRFALGVTPLTPGFGVVQIKPRPGALTQIAGTIPTIRGPIAVSWSHTPGAGPQLKVSLPGNTRANVRLPPALAACSPLLDGAPASLNVENGESWLHELEAGEHELACP